MPITKQTVAVVGADTKIGSTMAQRICTGNYRLLLISEDTEQVQPLATAMTKENSAADVEIMDCQYDACWEADIIMMTVPRSAYQQVADIIGEVATQKVVVGITEESSDVSDAMESRSIRKLKKLFPNSKVVGLASTEFAETFKNDSRENIKIIGENEKAREMVADLLHATELNTVTE